MLISFVTKTKQKPNNKIHYQKINHAKGKEIGLKIQQ